MIKASEGGGGKGIRKVEKPEEFAAAFRQVQNEIPGSPIFVMKLAKCARHLEVCYWVRERFLKFNFTLKLKNYLNSCPLWITAGKSQENYKLVSNS